MTGKFAGLGQAHGDDPRDEAVPVTTKRRSAATRPTKVSRQVERTVLVQARVTVGRRNDFKRVMIDLQDFFVDEVTQEEGISGLLALASENEAFREAWIETIARLREKG